MSNGYLGKPNVEASVASTASYEPRVAGGDYSGGSGHHPRDQLVLHEGRANVCESKRGEQGNLHEEASLRLITDWVLARSEYGGSAPLDGVT